MGILLQKAAVEEALMLLVVFLSSCHLSLDPAFRIWERPAPSNLEPPSSRALKADPNDAAKHDYFGGTSYTSSIMGPQTYSNC